MQSRPSEESNTSSTQNTTHYPSQQTQHGFFRNAEPDQNFPSDRKGRGGSRSLPGLLSATGANNDAASPNDKDDPANIPTRSVKSNPSEETVRSISRVDQYEKGLSKAQLRKSRSPDFKIVSTDKRSSKGEITIDNFPNGTNSEASRLLKSIY